MIKQKIQKFKKQIRKKHLQVLFQSKRNQLLQPHQISQFHPTLIYNSNQHPTQIFTFQQQQNWNNNKIQIKQLWKGYQTNLQVYLNINDYQRIIIILKQIVAAFKKMNNKKNNLYNRRIQCLQLFSQTNILLLIIKIVIKANNQNMPNGIIQNLSTNSISILLQLITCHKLHFKQQFFLQLDVLMFLRICISEPSINVEHLSNMLQIINQMIKLSQDNTGLLFKKLNNFQCQIFHFGAPFFNISKFQLQPQKLITINFLIFVKFYLLYIEKSEYIAYNNLIINNNSNQLTPLNNNMALQCNFSKQQKDICFQVAINSVHHYLSLALKYTFNFNETTQTYYNFQQSLQVLRLLIQKSTNIQKWLHHINYKQLIQLLRLNECPYEIIQKILIIIDHLIYIDQNNIFIHQFVKNCQLISIIWSVKNNFQNYVMNIISNLAAFPQFREQLRPYDHKICMMLKYQNNCELLYRFIYNRFTAQEYIISQAIDQLMLRVLAQTNNKEERTRDIQSLLWLRLIENNGIIKIPDRILRYNNPSSRYIKDHLLKEESNLL